MFYILTFCTYLKIRKTVGYLFFTAESTHGTSKQTVPNPKLSKLMRCKSSNTGAAAKACTYLHFTINDI